jgi:hypothetical protein
MKEPLVRAVKEPLIMVPLLFAVNFGILLNFSPQGAIFELDYLQFLMGHMMNGAMLFFLGLSVWLIGLAIAKCVRKETRMKGPLVRAVKEPLIMVPLLFAVSSFPVWIPDASRPFFLGLSVWLIGLAIAKLGAKYRKPMPVASD